MRWYRRRKCVPATSARLSFGTTSDLRFTATALMETLIRFRPLLGDGTPIVGGQIAAAYADPGFQSIFANMPLPNLVPTLNNPYNYQTTTLCER